MVVSANCANVVPGSPLDSACKCALATDSLSQALSVFTLKMEKYGIDFASFQRYELAKQAYDAKASTERNRISAETTSGTCAPFNRCSDSNCDQSGWVESGSTYSCDIGAFTRSGCAKNCKRSPEFVNSLMDVWKRDNPAPVIVSRPEQPKAITGVNILCCSQYIGDIESSKVSISNINQNCRQEINKQISDLGTPVVPGSTTVPSPGSQIVPVVPPPDDSSQTTFLLFILISVLILGAFVFFII